MVSIIIPTYNSSLTIRKCLQSILCQSVSAYEIIIIDGNSKDETLDIIQKLSASTSKISFISEVDNGVYDAMNKGIDLAKGEWLYFLGSDDTLYDDKVLEDIFSKNTSGFDVIYGNVMNLNMNKVYDGEFSYEKICMEGICHQSIFYRRSLFEKFGKYDHEMKVYAHVYLDKILFTDPGVRWRYVNRIIANYHGSGMSATTFDVKYWQNAEALLKKCFQGKLSDRIIYASLIPYTHWYFSAGSFITACKIALFGGNFKGLYYWFNHPYQFLKLSLTKHLRRTRH